MGTISYLNFEIYVEVKDPKSLVTRLLYVFHPFFTRTYSYFRTPRVPPNSLHLKKSFSAIKIPDKATIIERQKERPLYDSKTT
jgi:hypothetical protein